MEEVVGKVREVVSNGLYIVLDGGTTAFLPKENMNIILVRRKNYQIYSLKDM